MQRGLHTQRVETLAEELGVDRHIFIAVSWFPRLAETEVLDICFKTGKLKIS